MAVNDGASGREKIMHVRGGFFFGGEDRSRLVFVVAKKKGIEKKMLDSIHGTWNGMGMESDVFFPKLFFFADTRKTGGPWG